MFHCDSVAFTRMTYGSLTSWVSDFYVAIAIQVSPCWLMFFLYTCSTPSRYRTRTWYVLQKVNNYSLEHAMCDFHRSHHDVYFFVLEKTMLIKISILRQRTKILPKTCPSVLISTNKSVPQSDEN